jgi:hypothetical protein
MVLAASPSGTAPGARQAKVRRIEAMVPVEARLDAAPGFATGVPTGSTPERMVHAVSADEAEVWGRATPGRANQLPTTGDRDDSIVVTRAKT